MSIVAIILAGGIGSRMGLGYPKQFMEVNNKPIIAYTIDKFEINEKIDRIVIVCEKNWINHLHKILDKFNYTKEISIVEGGSTSHDSTRNGIFSLKDSLSSTDFVIIHDAARPILPQTAINNMIELGKEKGNACLAIPCYETIILTDDGKSGDSQLDRSKIMRIQTPQMYNYKSILTVYEQSEKDGRHDFVYANIAAIHYGLRIYFSKGFSNNIKVTRPEDVPLFESLLKFTDEQLYSF